MSDSISRNTHDIALTLPEQQCITVNNKGEIIFDETSLGLLDEYIRKVIREEMQAMEIQLFKEFEQYLAQQFRLGGINHGV